VLITNEFHEFCWSTILGRSDDGKAPYEPKIHTHLYYDQYKGVHRQYDMEGWCGTSHGSSQPKVGPVGPTPLAGRPCPGAFPRNIFTTCQSKSVRGVSIVAKAVERLNVAARPSFMAGRPDKCTSRARPSFMAGRPDKCTSRAQSSARAEPYSY
jgi:hypothetical protein